MFISEAIHSFFIWYGYLGFWHWVLTCTLDNLYWIIVLGPVAVVVWHVTETVWGKRIMKKFRAFLRWVKRRNKPGVKSDYDLLKIERRKNRKLKGRIRYVESLIQHKEAE